MKEKSPSNACKDWTVTLKLKTYYFPYNFPFITKVCSYIPRAVKSPLAWMMLMSLHKFNQEQDFFPSDNIFTQMAELSAQSWETLGEQCLSVL